MTGGGDRVWLVFDARAEYQSTDDCTVLVSCESLREARGYVRKGGMFEGNCIFEYDLVDNVAVNERRVR